MRVQLRNGQLVVLDDDGTDVAAVPVEEVQAAIDEHETTLQAPESLTVEGVEAAVGDLGPAEGEAVQGEPEPAAPQPADARRWRAVLAIVGASDDGRYFRQFDNRQLPVTLYCQTQQPEYGGHAGAEVAGRIDWMEQRGRVILGGGIYNSDSIGQYAADRNADQSLTGVSIDAIGTGDYVCTEWGSDPMFGVMCTDAVFVFEEATICGATQLGIPAFAAARMEMVPPTETDEQASAALGRMAAQAESLIPPEPDFQPEPVLAVVDELVAHAGRPTMVRPPVEPPREWFEAAEPDHLVPLHITEDGQVYGHVAPWGQCHTGYPGACVTAPQSPSQYAFFNSRQIACADGTVVLAGPVTVGVGHAGSALSADRALAHYDNSGHALADVTLTDGKLGVWACGAARPTITPEQVREFNACGPSGDWRTLRGQLDLIAVLMVNTQGFPLVAAAVVMHEGGRLEQRSLVTGMRPRVEDRLAAEIAGMRIELSTVRAKLEANDMITAAMFRELEPKLFETLQASIEQG